MLNKLNIGVGIVALCLLALKLLGYEFEPFPNFIFAFLGLMFILQGLEHFQADRKWEGALLSFTAFIAFLVVLTSF